MEEIATMRTNWQVEGDNTTAWQSAVASTGWGVQEFWSTQVACYPDSVILLWGNILILFVVNVIGAGLFTIFDVFFLFRSIRLSWHLNKPARTGDGRYEPTVSDLLMCIQVSMCNFFFAIVPLCVVGAPFLGLRGLTAQGEIPGFWSVVLQIAFFMIMEDFLGYFIHRWLHSPWAYKHIHGKHHEYKHPFALANLYMHPGEIFTMGCAVVAGPVLLGAHVFTHWVWLLYRVVDSYYQHSGYAVPYDPRHLIQSQPQQHDSHHHFRNSNYGFNFSLMDRLFGTYRNPYFVEEEEENKKQ